MLVVVAFFAYRGFRNGLLKSVARVLSILAGYTCAILFTGDLSAQVESRFDLHGIAAFVCASAILFIGAGALVMLLFWLIEKLLVKRDSPSTASACGGAFVGSLVGLLLGIVVIWGYGFVRGMISLDTASSVAQARPGGVEGFANQVASKAVNKALSMGSVNPEVARFSAAMIESPADITQRGKRLMQSDEMLRLLQDPDNQAVLNSGDYGALEQLPAFQQLLQNPDLQSLAASTGLADEAHANNRTVDSELARQFTDIWQRTQQVKNDRRVQEILADPEFQRKIQSGNPLDLLNNRQLLELADIIFAEDSSADDSNPGAGSADAGDSKPATEVFSWTDSSGRVHYSDKPPDDQVSQ